jgi:hypothetical protein
MLFVLLPISVIHTLATHPLPIALRLHSLATPTNASPLIAPLPTLLHTNPQSLAPASLALVWPVKTVPEIVLQLLSHPTLLSLVLSPPVTPPRTNTPTVIPHHVLRQTPA